MALDLFGAMLSGGLSAYQIPRDSLRESGLSQVFLAIDPKGLGVEQMDSIAEGMIANLHAAEPVETGKTVRYPGEKTLRVRRENMELGVPVDEELWKQLLAQDY